MSFRFSRYLRKSMSASLMMCAFLCLISTQPLVLAHDLTHADHEKTELCNVLNTFGANKDCISSREIPLLSPHIQSHTSVWIDSNIDKAIVLNRRSRAPPLSNLVNLPPLPDAHELFVNARVFLVGN